MTDSMLMFSLRRLGRNRGLTDQLTMIINRYRPIRTVRQSMLSSLNKLPSFLLVIIMA